MPWPKMDRLPPWQNHWRESLASSMSGLPTLRSQPAVRGRSDRGRLSSLRSAEVPGERLTIATMLGPSNDLFYGPREEGIALFADTRKPLAGDITSSMLLGDG